MTSASSHLLEAVLDLAWSHWTGLGVRGSVRPPDTAVDPESLIYLTAALGSHDGRLRDEVTDWWSRYQHHVSRSRVNRLARSFDPEVVQQFTKLEAHVARGDRTSGKSALDSLDLPARALIRLRCIFGINARAEIILALLSRSPGDHTPTAAALAEVGYSKRNVALVLEDLCLSGLVVTSSETNRTHYRIANPDALRAAVGPVPTTAGRWHVRLPIIAAFVSAADRWRHKDPLVLAVEARKLLAKHARAIATLQVAEPRAVNPENYWSALQRWIIDNVIRLPRSASR